MIMVYKLCIKLCVSVCILSDKHLTSLVATIGYTSLGQKSATLSCLWIQTYSIIHGVTIHVEDLTPLNMVQLTLIIFQYFHHQYTILVNLVEDIHVLSNQVAF